MKGERYGDWTVIGYAERERKDGHTYLVVKCLCGKTSELRESDLRNRKTSQCASCAAKTAARLRIIDDKEYTINTVYGYYKKSARSRDISFEINKEFFRDFIFENCYYCGISPSNKLDRRIEDREAVKYNGLDRMDPSRGYIPDNLVTCCGTCNQAKASMTASEFFEWIARVAEYTLRSAYASGRNST